MKLLPDVFRRIPMRVSKNSTRSNNIFSSQHICRSSWLTTRTISLYSRRYFRHLFHHTFPCSSKSHHLRSPRIFPCLGPRSRHRQYQSETQPSIAEKGKGRYDYTHQQNLKQKTYSRNSQRKHEIHNMSSIFNDTKPTDPTVDFCLSGSHICDHRRRPTKTSWVFCVANIMALMFFWVELWKDCKSTYKFELWKIWWTYIFFERWACALEIHMSWRCPVYLFHPFELTSSTKLPVWYNGCYHCHLRYNFTVLQGRFDYLRFNC